MTSAIERAVAAVGPKPYYEHAGITIYHGDCRDVLPDIQAGTGGVVPLVAAHALRTLIGRTAKCQMTERVI